MPHLRYAMLVVFKVLAMAQTTAQNKLVLELDQLDYFQIMQLEFQGIMNFTERYGMSSVIQNIMSS